MSYQPLREDSTGPDDRTTTQKILFALGVVVLLGIGVGVGVVADRAISSLNFQSPQYSSSGISCIPPVNGPTSPKNLILVIGDGFSPATATFIRTMLGRPLSFDKYLIGTVETASGDSYITDSAAAATSMACGVKSPNNGVGIDNDRVPKGSVLEAAITAGVSTGIVVTSPIHHATPAAFSSHALTRYMKAFITKQQIQSGTKLMFGGGADEFNKTDILNIAKQKGYNIIHSASQLNFTQLPSLGLFADDGLPYEIDRVADAGLYGHVPSLYEMTYTALNLLKDEERGFFLLVEGSEIDWAEHANDAGALYHEAVQFEKTFELIIQFALERNDTLVLLTADHETGGISMGSQTTFNQPGAYFWHPEVVKNVTRSAEYIGNLLETLNSTQIIDTVTRLTGITTLTQADLDILDKAPTDIPYWYAVASIISFHARLGWTTQEHTGVDVNLYGYGPGVTNFCGHLDNTDIAKRISRIFGWDIDAVTEKLKNFNVTG